MGSVGQIGRLWVVSIVWEVWGRVGVDIAYGWLVRCGQWTLLIREGLGWEIWVVSMVWGMW